METIRQFITDDRLHKILDHIEYWFGYTLSAVPMPLYYQEKARCSVHLNQQTNLFEMWYIKEEPQPQSVYCHELAHLVIFINGATNRYTFNDPVQLLFLTDPVRLFLDQIWKYMQHVPVFALVKELGYDEIGDYDAVVAGLIGLLRHQQLFPVMDVPSLDPLRDQMRCQAGALAQCLALPMAEETRAGLKTLAKEMLPQSFELADAILSGLGTRTLLGPQEYQEYLSEIYQISGLPKGNLQFSFLNRTCQNFRSRILEVAKPY